MVSDADSDQFGGEHMAVPASPQALNTAAPRTPEMLDGELLPADKDEAPER